MSGDGFSVSPITVKDARRWVQRHHSHHNAPRGGLAAVGVVSGGRLCCVAILGRPVSRQLQTAGAVEVTRVASDGMVHGAASACVRAAGALALALGFRRAVSYTILGERGTSYRKAGWRVTGLSGGGNGTDPHGRGRP